MTLFYITNSLVRARTVPFFKGIWFWQLKIVALSNNEYSLLINYPKSLISHFYPSLYLQSFFFSFFLFYFQNWNSKANSILVIWLKKKVLLHTCFARVFSLISRDFARVEHSCCFAVNSSAHSISISFKSWKKINKTKN